MNTEPIAGGPVAELHAAAERLREIVRANPRGPWRWGDADPPEPGGELGERWPWPGGPGPGGPHVGGGSDPSASFADLVRGRAPGRPPVPEPPRPAGPPSDGWVDPTVAGPLADLLEAIADRAAAQQDPAPDAEPLRSALRVAAALRREDFRP